jgi:hypothetical protein
MTDIEIARSAPMRPIVQVAEQLGIHEDHLIPFGKFKAKVSLDALRPDREADSRLILVTAVSPTPAGEGKTTVSVGLADGLAYIGKKSAVALREPSLGPVFGMKGGAAGGGQTQVVPMEDINLHFTGDFSAVEKANNLLAALIDNNIQSSKRSLGIDPRTVVWKRVMDMNDRSLRQTVIGLGGKANGVPREDGFNITPASEVMAILCMSKSFKDLKERLGNIYIGQTYNLLGEYKRIFGDNFIITTIPSLTDEETKYVEEFNQALVQGNLKQYFEDLFSTGQFQSSFRKDDSNLSPEELSKREKDRAKTKIALEKNIDKIADTYDDIQHNLNIVNIEELPSKVKKFIK